MISPATCAAKEKSQSAYLQYSKTFETRMPFHVAAGVRYEETEVYSESLVRIGETIGWDSANEFNIRFATEQGFDSGTGKYDYVLPSLDLKLDIRDNLVARASYSETIGRPGWNDIQGGANLAGQLRFDGGTGSSGIPASSRWNRPTMTCRWSGITAKAATPRLATSARRSPTSSAMSITVETPFEMHTPAGGAYWNEAIASGCDVGDRPCIRNFIFDNHTTVIRVSPDGYCRNGTGGTIMGLPGDPIATFQMTRPANMRSDELDGWEFNIQQMFGDSGFGVSG